MEYSQSKVKAYRKCPKNYDYKYRQGLERRTKPATLMRGVTFHEMLDARVLGKDPMEPLKQYTEQYNSLFNDQKELYSSPEEMLSLYNRYVKFWEHDGLDYQGITELEIQAEYKGKKFKGIIDKIPKDSLGRTFICDHKCLDSEHWVHTSQGKVQLKHLTTDDLVLSSSGKWIKVLEVVHQTLPGFEISLKGGKKFKATAEHRWPILGGTHHKLKPTLTDTQSLLSFEKAYLLPSPPLQLPPQDFSLHPYVVGCLIGDGCLGQGTRFCCPEEELLNKFSSFLPSGSQITKVSSENKASSYYISGLRNEIKKLGLLGKRSWEKSIPPEYQLGSFDQRMELLRGLMDTDGTVYKGSGYLYITTSESLSQEVVELVTGLGGTVLIRSPKSNHYQGGKQGRKSYQVKFHFPDEHPIPFHLTRKVEKVVSRGVFFGSDLKVLSVIPVGDLLVTDITVDSEDHLFSCEGVLTHNTHKVLPDEDARFSDIQTVLYYWAARENGTVTDGVMWDYIRTKPPAVPEVLVKGGLSQRANIDSDYDTYMNRILELGLNPEPYRGILQKLKSNVFFKRVYLPKPSEQLIKSVVGDFFQTVEEIESAEEANRFPRNMTKECKLCSHYPICSEEVRGIDSSFTKKQLFTIRAK